MKLNNLNLDLSTNSYDVLQSSRLTENEGDFE